jgi:NAD-dependent histone deacetylase SIR2
MGNEESTMVDESVKPKKLQARTIDALASYITSGKVRKVVVLTGAGISTSAGIPDFRSPDTGLYANLERLNLPHAEAVFDIAYFRTNPLPFYTLAQELYPGRYRPTVTHSFIKLLHDKGLLLQLLTQNIDCLEREAGVPGDKIVEAHGSFASQSCIECKKAYPEERMRDAITNKWVPRCVDASCNGLVKPDIVFFGEQLPAAFFDSRDLLPEADLCIVMGTSLSVQPFASLPGFCEDGVPRLLVNQERVGDLGSRPDDVLMLEDCDAGVRKLAKACGWADDLEALWAQTAKDDAAAAAPAPVKEKPRRTRDELLQDEVDKLALSVDETLALGKKQHEWLEKHVDRKIAQDAAEQQKEAEDATAAHLQPSADPNSVTLAPAPAPAPGTSEGKAGLEHVFPFLGAGKKTGEGTGNM